MTTMFSEVSSALARISRLVTDRLAWAPGTVSGGLEAEARLQPYTLVDGNDFRDTLDALGIAIEAGSIGLVNPGRWIDRPPHEAERTPDIALLAAHQWPRYGAGKRDTVSAARVVSMWRQRLQRLADAAGDRPLLCLLGHSEPVDSDAAAVFDADAQPATDAPTTRHPISADAFLCLAASAGLFCAEPPAFVRNENGICERALYCLTRRDYTVRSARESDIEALERLEEQCWIPSLRTPRRNLLARIKTYPQGQFVLELGGEVKGVIYSQRIRNDADLAHRTMDDVHRLHDLGGDLVQLLAVNIDPGSQNLACGDQLLEFMLQRSCLQRGVRRIVAVTLCKDYAADLGMSIEAYVAGPGRTRDRVLHFHHLHGAEIAATLPGYRPRDIANHGKGVLVRYDPSRRRVSASAPGAASAPAEAGSPPALVRDEALRFVIETVSNLVDSAHIIDPDRPLMEWGLDSGNLLNLKTRLEARFGKRLKPSFFFTHNTPRKVVDYFCPDRSASAPAAAAARPADAPGEVVDIAIVGIGCRLPQGIDDLDALWDVLDAQRDMITEYPVSRGEWPRGGGIERGGFLSDGECFDAQFFRISPREAEVTDPQQRLLLEVSWACFEDAGILPAALRGTDTGVFVGASNSDYAHLLQDAGTEVEAHFAVGNSLAVLANRLSYFYDFNGPSLLIDTACSASMVALHGAIQSLRARECGLALVGGVNFICNPRISMAYRKAGMLSPDGRCKAFDDSANGYVRAEGAVVLLLKPLREAVADRNRIHAVIRGSAVNHGGQAAGLTVPNPQRQATLLTAAWRNARISAQEISYIEAHGTGTSLGDPIEIEGMQSAFAAAGVSVARCDVGSIKSNLGHMESAAGLAGVLKVVAAMAHRRLPASIHVSTLNTRMDLRGSPLQIVSTTRAWDAPAPRVAGVSSFGSGGANGHVVLQEYVPACGDDVAEVVCNPFPDGNLFVLSGVDDAALRRNARAVLSWLHRYPAPQRFVDSIHIWQRGRTAFAYRLAFHVRDFRDLEQRLKDWLGSGDVANSAGRNTGTHAGGSDLARWNAAIAQRDWSMLARLWLEGREGDWVGLYAGMSSPPRFLKLPGYAFDRERYWVQPQPQPQPRVADDVLMAVPTWRPLGEAQAAPFERHVVLLCDTGPQPDALAVALREDGVELRCVALAASGDDAAARYRSLALQCFEELRALAHSPSRPKTLIQCVIRDRGDAQTGRGLSALLRTVAMEQSLIVGQVVGIDGDSDPRTLAARLRAIALRPRAALLRCRSERVEALDWLRLSPAAPVESVYKETGVYVITGGLGALARLFVGNIAEHCAHATVVLTGRSPETDAIAGQVADLERIGTHAGTRIVYRQLDLGDSAAVAALFDELYARHGTVNGILHCAGAIADSLIVNKRAEDFAATLQPKVDGTRHLDEASRDHDLDFFVVFSSIASVMGSIGQTDYAAANGFMDHFVHYRQELASRGERRGASLSINWPYWRHGGMRIDAATQTVLEQNIGMLPMETDIGLSAFHLAVFHGRTQMVVAQGDPDKLLARLRGENFVAAAAVSQAPVQAPAERLSIDMIQKELRRMLAEVLHARPEDIELRKPLFELGLDSMLGTEFVGAINRRFSAALSSVAIYDHPNITALAQYLDATQPKPSARSLAVRGSAVRYVVDDARPRQTPLAPVAGDARIAVIGMSGRYPQAKNLGAYWRNLVEARNAIVPIPDTRWDVAAYYDPDPDAEGRMYVRSMGLLDDVEVFDPRFFRITPQEALYMDPEQRLFLQESYRALEDAGYVGGDDDGLNCGVYLGMESSEYAWQFADSPRVSETITGNHEAIAASRLAYFLNLKGPALAVDTACSSSLVAAHLACQALRCGEVDLALAGGVRLWLSPVMHIGMCKARMLSPSGQCRTFDDTADGIVMGEGVGAVVLKRLAEAVRDGDHIHGVILASGINQDGRTNGITAPSVKSQIALERRMYLEHGIDPESISYIEAHGTGTRLGDPIELQALDTVFREHTRRQDFCAIGSVKTNIGHTGAASGVAGLHKVLLCLKYRQLVPTLNVETPNRHFDFERSPFYINRERRDWVPGVGGRRRACVSSFGFSGTNAHMVLEEYVPPVATTDAAEAFDDALIALSARNRAQLRSKALDLLAFVEREAPEESDAAFLASFAYTLQVGRAEMEERAAFVVRSLDELKAGLRVLGEDRSGGSVDVQRARVVEEDEFLTLWNTDEDLRATAAKWQQDRRFAKLTSLWVKGVSIDWRRLYGATPPLRMSLPAYPFAEERYWIDRREQTAAAAPAAGAHDVRAAGRSDEPLHPLVHRNVSDLSRQAYHTTLSADDFHLRDHRVHGARVLPGVAYLEMVRAAAALALPGDRTRTLEFQDHAWIQPVVVDDAFALTVVLHDNGEDEDGGRWLEYEIFSEGGGGETPHARGTLRFGADTFDADPVDLAAVDEAIDGANCDRNTLYARFEALGLCYGPTMQGIAELRSDGDEVIARLRLPGASDPRFGLHPAMMDAAMQCTICLLAGLDGEGGAAVMPFAFDDMIVHGGTTDEMWVWVRRAPGAPIAGMPSLDIDLVDDQGLPRVSIRGLVSRTVASAPVVASTRAVGAAPALARPAATPASRPALRALVPIWNPVRFGRDAVTPVPGERCLLLGGDEALFAWLRAAPIELRHQPIVAGDSVERIERLLSDREFDHLLWFAPEADVGDHDAIVPSQDAGVLSLFRILKSLSRLDWFERELKFTVVTRRALQVFDDELVSPHHASVHGMVGSVAKELPLWRFRLLDIESTGDLDAREILALPWDEQGRGLAFRCDEWFRQEFADVGRMPSSRTAYRHKGVYVVIGGAGGLGEVWTRHMVAHYDAEVIWVGRRPQNADIEAKIDAIAGLGRQPHYFSADATDAAALATAVAAIRERFPRIDGVVHSALVLQDQTMRAMDEAVFRQSLAAKVDVSVNIERAFAGQELDFVLFFSSVSSFHRGAGQSNYCAGCTFKDSFAQAMRARHPYPVKIVNWGYWGSVGVVTDAFYRKRMESLGIGSIEPDEAMRELEAFVASDMDQLALIKVISQRALDDLWVSEEVRYYQDHDASSGYGGEAVIAS